MSNIGDMTSAKALMKAWRGGGLGEVFVVLAWLGALGGALLGMIVLADGNESYNEAQQQAGVFIIVVSISQALFIGAIGGALQLLQSLATTNARLVDLAAVSVDVQQRTNADTARTVSSPLPRTTGRHGVEGCGDLVRRSTTICDVGDGSMLSRRFLGHQ